MGGGGERGEAPQFRITSSQPKKKVNVYNTYASTFTGKKKKKNDGSHAVIVIIVGGKPLITTNKLAGPVGK